MSSEKKPIVLGKFVYIELPPKEESKLIVDENTKEALSKELLIKMQKLKIWATGDAANPKLKEGQVVLVNPSALQKAQIVPINGSIKALILDYDIIHIWP